MQNTTIRIVSVTHPSGAKSIPRTFFRCPSRGIMHCPVRRSHTSPLPSNPLKKKTGNHIWRVVTSDQESFPLFKTELLDRSIHKDKSLTKQCCDVGGEIKHENMVSNEFIRVKNFQTGVPRTSTSSERMLNFMVFFFTVLISLINSFDTKFQS